MHVATGVDTLNCVQLLDEEERVLKAALSLGDNSAMRELVKDGE